MEQSSLTSGGNAGDKQVEQIVEVFFSHAILRPVQARSQCDCKLRADGASHVVAFVPARVGEDLMQVRHGSLTQLGGRGQLEERRRIGALRRGREHTGPPGDPG